MDAQTLMNITQQLAVGLLDSCKIFFLTLLFSMPLGLLVTFGRMSKWAPLKFLAPQTLVEKLKLAQSAEGKAENLPMDTRFAGGLFFFKPIQWIIKVFIAILRGTPLMLQLFAVYYGPYCLFGIPITNEYRFTAVIIAFSINYAAYFAEMFTIAKQISAAQTTIMPLIIAGVFYFIFNGIVAFVMDKIEKKMNYYR